MGWLKDTADDMLTEYASYYTDGLNARNDLYYAGDYIEAENWTEAKNSLYDAGDLFGNAFSHMAQGPPWGYGCSYYHRDIYYWLEDNWPSAPSITMADILSAMYDATSTQVLKFIWYLEGYKAATWNATFFESELAELAKRWAVWL